MGGIDYGVGRNPPLLVNLTQNGRSHRTEISKALGDRKMQYSRATVGQVQLDEYVAVVPKIYSAHDQNRSIWDVWCHTLHHGAAVAERIRKKAPADKLFTEVADFTLWLLTTVYKLSGKPGKRKTAAETPAEMLVRIGSGCSDLLWHRYPGVCHLCYARRMKITEGSKGRRNLVDPCDCSEQSPDGRDKKTKRLDSSSLRKFSEANRGRKPKTIDDWQAMFAAIFGADIKQLSRADIGLHLMEELGEVSDALVRMYSYTKKDFRAGEPNWRQARLEGQIADVFSWLFALVHKVNEAEPVTLSEIVWRRYGSDRLQAFRCPSCDRVVCSCRLIFIPATRPTKEWLQKFQTQRRTRRAK